MRTITIAMIIVVDDDAAFRSALIKSLQKEGYHVVGFGEAGKALDFSGDNEPDLIISDILMPEMNGYDFRTAYVERFPCGQRLLCSCRRSTTKRTSSRGSTPVRTTT